MKDGIPTPTNPDFGGLGFSTQVITSILSRAVAALLRISVVVHPS
jgi:hypothetical protein